MIRLALSLLLSLVWLAPLADGAAYHSNKAALYAAQDGLCGGCQIPFLKRNLEVDHILARSKGGTDTLANLQLLCGFCNRVKGADSMEVLQQRLATVHRIDKAELAEHVKRACQLAVP